MSTLRRRTGDSRGGGGRVDDLDFGDNGSIKAFLWDVGEIDSRALLRNQ